MDNISTEEFFNTLLEKIGVDPAERKEIIKTFRNTLVVTMVGVMKDSIPEEKQNEIGAKLSKSENWIEALSEEAKKLGDKEWMAKEVVKRLTEKTNEFIDLLIEKCPEEHRSKVYEYVSSISSS
ncbi:MAG TPA: hypothetical protein VMX77_01560 [Candidatus Bathyarchaeia archaeon]|nr:hypothetical protein [Candidatus Bathyarchaeia archaeon]